VQQADDRTRLAIGALAFALGILAAIPTGGSSLIAAGPWWQRPARPR
jgi:hypothetical protein